jgi:predicted DNA-binding protein
VIRAHVCHDIATLATMTKPNQTRHHIFMPPEMMDRLRAAKEQTGVPVAEFIRRAIDAALRECGL